MLDFLTVTINCPRRLKVQSAWIHWGATVSSHLVYYGKCDESSPAPQTVDALLLFQSVDVSVDCFIYKREAMAFQLRMYDHIKHSNSTLFQSRANEYLELLVASRFEELNIKANVSDAAQTKCDQ